MIIPVLLGKTVFISCCTCSPCSAQLMMSCSDISAQKQTRNNHCSYEMLTSVTINYQQLLLIVHTMLSDVHIPADKLIQNFAILRTFVLNASWKLSSKKDDIGEEKERKRRRKDEGWKSNDGQVEVSTKSRILEKVTGL